MIFYVELYHLNQIKIKLYKYFLKTEEKFGEISLSSGNYERKLRRLFLLLFFKIINTLISSKEIYREDGSWLLYYQEKISDLKL